jgi:hypothetical protein
MALYLHIFKYGSLGEGKKGADMQKFVHLLIIFSLIAPSLVSAEDYCVEKKPKQETRKRDPKEFKGWVAAISFPTGSLAHDIIMHNWPHWAKAAMVIKYATQLVGTGAVLSIGFDVIEAGAGDDFTTYYKRHPEQLEKLAQLSDNELKTFAATDETGEFAEMVRTARANRAR